MRRLIIKSTIDGFIHALALLLLSVLIVVPATKDFDFLSFFVIAGITSIILAIAYFLFLRKEKKVKSVLIGSGISVISFVIFSMIILFIQVEFPFVVARDIWYGEGITSVLVSEFFIATTFFLKLCVFVGLLIRNAYQNTKLQNENIPE